SRRSTETSSSSTVSTAPPSATHGPPGPCRKDHREGRYISMVGTVSPPTDARYTPDDPSDPSAPSAPETSPLMGNFKDAQHPGEYPAAGPPGRSRRGPSPLGHGSRAPSSPRARAAPRGISAVLT